MTGKDLTATTKKIPLKSSKKTKKILLFDIADFLTDIHLFCFFHFSHKWQTYCNIFIHLLFIITWFVVKIEVVRCKKIDKISRQWLLEIPKALPKAFQVKEWDFSCQNNNCLVCSNVKSLGGMKLDLCPHTRILLRETLGSYLVVELLQGITKFKHYGSNSFNAPINSMRCLMKSFTWLRG